ncbi:Uncharacterised protein [Mycoplasmopsis gallopavonis]|uniref:Fungal lipase-like domain-containing protein n=1 Tax=Mycoplasmopsis gallopavonis TaxID=76629 RepID=A0A449AYI3_9BACT|nr:hypothetical protein [Mycoplasmopsis gallopavonis]VEU72561.1 Uncharacterised protein [Mycoplasmopsis gallopavonis]
MKKNKIQRSKKILLIALPILGFGSIFSISSIQPHNIQSKTPLTSEAALKISSGEIKLYGGYYDSLLFQNPPLDPEGDDDHDGILNKDEVYTFVENGQTYYWLNSHPKLQDTDGDGILDNQDQHKLRWDVSLRDMAFFQELAYRKKNFIFDMFNDDNYKDYKDNVQKSLDKDKPGKYADNPEMRNMYVNMQYEMSRYWQPVYVWDEENGFDATWFTNQSDFPFIESQTENIWAIAGTDKKESGDLGADAKIFTGGVPEQAYKNVNIYSWMWQDWNIRKKYANLSDQYFNSAKFRDPKNPNDTILNKTHNIPVKSVGHSLGGYLAQMVGVYLLANQKYHSNFDNFKGAWTFNAPQVKGQYGKISDLLINSGYSHNYMTNSDPLIGWVGHFRNVKTVGSSGHSSSGFFDPAPIKNFFSNGVRKSDKKAIVDLQPQLKELALDTKYYTIHYNSQKLGKLKETKLVYTNKERFRARLEKDVPNGYRIKKTFNLQSSNLANQEIPIEPITHTITYNFKFGNNLIKTEKRTISIEEPTYKVPSLPIHSDIHKKYVSSNNSPLPTTSDLTKDTTFNIQLQVEDNKVTTTIKIIDAQTRKQIGETHTQKGYLDETIKIQDSWYQPDYLLESSNQTIHVGQENEITVKLINYIRRYIFKYNGKEIASNSQIGRASDQTIWPSLPKTNEPHYEYQIKEKRVQTQNPKFIIYEIDLNKVEMQKVNTEINYVSNSQTISTQTLNTYPDDAITQSQLTLPEGYQLKNNNQTINTGQNNQVEVEKKSFILTYKFLDQNQVVKQQNITVKWHETYDLPQIPNGNEDYSYEVSGSYQKISNVEQNQTIEVHLSHLTKNTIIEYFDNDSKIDTQTITKAPNYQVQIKDLKLPENYVLVNSHQQIQSGQTNKVQITKQKRSSTLNYKDNGVLVSSQMITKAIDSNIENQDLQLPRGYLLVNPNQTFTLGQNYDVAITKQSFTLTYKFMFGETLVAKNDVIIKYHETYELPPLPNSNSQDFTYQASSNFQIIPNVEANQEIVVNLSKKQSTIN